MINEKAEELLRGEGLNQASLMRAMEIDPKDQTARKNFKSDYDAVLELFKPAGIYKQGHDYFLPKAEEKKSAESNDEMERLMKENDKLSQENLDLRNKYFAAENELFELRKQVGKPDVVVEERVWRYSKESPSGRIFNKSELESLGKEWVDHPDKV